MPWNWEPDTQRYRDATTGRFLAGRDVQRLAWEQLDRSASRYNEMAGMLTREELSLDDWQAVMRRSIKDDYVDQYLLGRGGLEQMTPTDWGSIGGMLNEQYRYLDGFAGDIATGNLSEAQIAYRSRLYMESAKEGFSRAQGRAAGWPALPAYPGDGSSKCGVRCRCLWEAERKKSDWYMTWVMNPEAEHCETCVERAVKWNPLVLPVPKARPSAGPEPKSEAVVRGGEGSGFKDHAGRPGEVGGSKPRSGAAITFGEGVSAEAQRIVREHYASYDKQKRDTVSSIIVSAGSGGEFEAGGQTFKRGGTWNKQGGEISLYDINEETERGIKRIMDHEIGHAIYDDWTERYTAQMRELINGPDAIRMDGSVRWELVSNPEKYDIYRSWDTWQRGWSDGEDGVTEYSKAWGNATETFAELHSHYETFKRRASGDARADIIAFAAQSGARHLGEAFVEVMRAYEDATMSDAGVDDG